MAPEGQKLRWYAPIWKDPLGWSRWGGNSRAHLFCAILFHLALWCTWAVALLNFATVRTIGDLGLLSHVPLLFLLALAFLASVFIPAAYLYALYLLIRIIDEKSKQP